MPAVMTEATMTTLFDDPSRYEKLTNYTGIEMRRMGRYENLVKDLLGGRIEPKVFTRKVRSWKPIRGEKCLADPREIFKILDRRRENQFPPFSNDL